MGRLVAIVSSVLGLLFTVIAALTAAAGLAALSGGIAGVFAFAALIAVAGATWLISVLCFIAAHLGSRSVRSMAAAALMWAASAANFLAGFTALSLFLGGGALTSLGRLYAAAVAVLLIVWGLLLAFMGSRKR